MYKKWLKEYIGKDLVKLQSEYPVMTDGLDPDCMKRLEDYFGSEDPEECEYVWLNEQEIEDLDIPYSNVDWAFGQKADTCSVFMKPAKKYLVFASGCRWDGASGYKFADSMWDACGRSYDASLYIENVSDGGKTLLLNESSHDVPMGSDTVIIALTEKEYESLKNKDFRGVEAFANKHKDVLVKQIVEMKYGIKFNHGKQKAV